MDKTYRKIQTSAENLAHRCIQICLCRHLAVQISRHQTFFKKLPTAKGKQWKYWWIPLNLKMLLVKFLGLRYISDFRLSGQINTSEICMWFPFHWTLTYITGEFGIIHFQIKRDPPSHKNNFATPAECQRVVDSSLQWSVLCANLFFVGISFESCRILNCAGLFACWRWKMLFFFKFC